jgi:hypothetical protein
MRPALALLLLPLLACGEEPPEDTEAAPAGDCEREPSGTAMLSGRWETATEEALSLGCENAAGKGMHVHVGETIPIEITRTGHCLEAVSEPGTPNELTYTGATDGEGFELEGSFSMEIGTCELLVEAVMTATLSGEAAFDYRMDATLSVLEEHSPDACSYIVGDSAKHTFPELPCSWAWGGTGTWIAELEE